MIENLYDEAEWLDPNRSLPMQKNRQDHQLSFICEKDL